jgi:hypothetical protein
MGKGGLMTKVKLKRKSGSHCLFLCNRFRTFEAGVIYELEPPEYKEMRERDTEAEFTVLDLDMPQPMSSPPVDEAHTLSPSENVGDRDIPIADDPLALPEDEKEPGKKKPGRKKKNQTVTN